MGRLKFLGQNRFKWPEKEDVHAYLTHDILSLIKAPTPVSQRGHYCLSDDDIDKSFRRNAELRTYRLIMTKI